VPQFCCAWPTPVASIANRENANNETGERQRPFMQDLAMQIAPTPCNVHSTTVLENVAGKF
jgi:hypothetical protein